ncbi:CAAX amino terminal protease family protein [Vibrio sp. JCM 19236]|nr:CAAX amino terminal protease family protein [Vibrio sp. JCM 19236]
MDSSKRYAIVFIVLVMGITWAFNLYIFKHQTHLSMYTLSMVIPGFVALSLNAFRYKSIKGITAPFSRRLSIKILGFSVGYPVIFITLLAALDVVCFIGTIDHQRLESMQWLPPLSVAMTGFLVVCAEEYGWRGFLLPNIASGFGELFATVAVGIVWAVWHIPAVLFLAKLTQVGNVYTLVGVQVVAMFVFSLPFAYCYFKSGSIIPPILFHFVWNYYNLGARQYLQ